jgi:hypothetical protein
MKNKCFRGRCPYTDKVCKIWLCRLCRIEHREREYAKSGYNAPPRTFPTKSNEITFGDERTREKAK